jgi:hypothetical protein
MFSAQLHNASISVRGARRLAIALAVAAGVGAGSAALVPRAAYAPEATAQTPNTMQAPHLRATSASFIRRHRKVEAAGYVQVSCRVGATAVVAAFGSLGLAPGPAERAAAVSGNPTQTFTVRLAPGVPAPWLPRSERAIELQSRSVRMLWGTPLVHFGAGGWLVHVRRGRYSDKPPGWHGVRRGRPYAVVETGTWAPTAGIFNHEILEMLVDPYGRHRIHGQLAEICDPVVGQRYRGSNGAVLVDWVYPTYFDRSATGPWDYLRLLAGGAR